MKDTYNSFTDEVIDTITKKLYEIIDKDVSITTLKRLVIVCFKRKYTYNDLYQLQKRNENFAIVWTNIKDELECRLIEFGLDRSADGTMSRFILKNGHEYKETSEVTNTNIEMIDVMPDFEDI